MRAKKDSRAKGRKKPRRRILKLFLMLVVVLIVLVLFLVPGFVSSEKGREIILAKINNSIDGKTDFGGLSMGWFKGIKVTDFRFNDSLGQIFVQVKQIATKPHYGSILMGSLSFGKTIIDEPKVEINLEPPSEKTEGSHQKPSADKRVQPIILPVKKIDLVVNDGNVKVTDEQAKSVELSQINSKVNLRPPGQETNFDVDVVVVDAGKGSKVHAGGRINPGVTKAGWSLKGTSGDLTVDVNDLDLGSLGPIFALSGVEIQAKGLVSANVKSEMQDGQFENLSGTIKAKNLDITGPQLKGDRFKTDTLEAHVKLARQKKMINIENLDIEADWLKARAAGTVPTTFDSFTEFLKSDSTLSGSFELDVAQFFSQMPHTFGVKEDMKVTSGQLSGNIKTFTKAGKKQIQGQANLVGLKGVVGEKTIALTEPVSATAQITSDKATINFDRLDVSASFAKVNCTGNIESLRYNADVNLAKLQSELGQFIDIGEYRMAGELVSKGQVSIKEDKIATVGLSVVKNLRLSSAEGVSASEPMAEAVFAFDIDRKNNIAAVDSVKVNASLGKVSIKDAVLPLNKKAAKAMELAVSANNVDLKKLQPFAVLFASFPKEMQLAGTAESNVSVSSKKDIYRITADSTKIKNLKVSYLEQAPLEQERVSVIFDAEVNPEQKTINVKKLQLESPQIKIKKGEFKKINKGGKTKLEGLVECEYDWEAVSTIASPFLPGGLKLQGKRKDAINFVSEYPIGKTDKLLGNLNTEAKLGFEKANYMGLNFGATDVDIQVQNGLLKVAPFSTKVNNGQLNFAGQADFKQKPTLLKTAGPIHIAKDININDETTRRLLMFLNPIFANAVNVSGVANFSCERLAIPLAGADVNSLEVIGMISISQLRLQASDLLGQILSITGAGARGVDIAIRPTKFVLRNGFVRYDDMQMDVGDNPVNFKDAIIGLDTSYDMTVVLPWTLNGRTTRVGQDTEGKRVELRLKAAAGEKPKLDMGKLLEGQLKKLLEDELRKGLEGLFK